MVQISAGIFSTKYKNQLLATLCANILTFSHGILIGWYAPTLFLLQSDETPLQSGKIGLSEVSWIGSLLCIGGLIGNIIFGFLVNKFGRKKALLLLGLPNVCSWTTTLFASNAYHFYISRLFAGTTGGGIFTTLPIFIAEIADNSIRGTLASMIMLMLNVGIFVGYIVGSYVPYHVFPFIIIGAPVIYTITITYFSETPQYLLENDRVVEAEASYKFYRNFKESSKEDLQKFNEDFTNLKVSVRGHGNSKDGDKLTIKDFFKPAARKGFIIGFCLMGLSQLSGGFSIVNYMANIFGDLKADVDVNSNTIIVGAVQAVGTYVSTILVDRVGRKILLTTSALTTALGLSGVGLYAYFATIFDLSYISWIPVVSLSFAIFSTCIGIVPLPLVVMTEVLPLKVRSVVTTALVIILSVQAFAVLKIYPLLIETIHVTGVMFFGCTICVLGAVFILIYVPETKGKSLTN